MSTKKTKQIDLLIDSIFNRIQNLNTNYPIDSVDINKIYFNNIKALSLLFKIKQDITNFEDKEVSSKISYDEFLNQIINNQKL